MIGRDTENETGPGVLERGKAKGGEEIRNTKIQKTKAIMGSVQSK